MVKNRGTLNILRVFKARKEEEEVFTCSQYQKRIKHCIINLNDADNE